MESKNNILKHFTNPALWVVLGGVIIAGVTSYNQIGQNTTYIETVESRLKKKIEIINDLEARTLEIEMQLIQRGESIKDLQSLKKEVVKLQVEAAELQKDIQYLTNQIKNNGNN